MEIDKCFPFFLKQFWGQSCSPLSLWGMLRRFRCVQTNNHTNPNHNKNLQSDVDIERYRYPPESPVDGSLDGRRHYKTLWLDDELCHRKQNLQYNARIATATALAVQNAAAMSGVVYQESVYCLERLGSQLAYASGILSRLDIYSWVLYC